jgi:hypothetical protein
MRSLAQIMPWDLWRPAQGFQGAGHEVDGEAMTNRKGEITRGDLKRK